MVKEQRDTGSKFLPTPSARRATAPGKGHHRRSDISTHALREEGDPTKG